MNSIKTRTRALSGAKLVTRIAHLLEVGEHTDLEIMQLKGGYWRVRLKFQGAWYAYEGAALADAISIR